MRLSGNEIRARAADFADGTANACRAGMGAASLDGRGSAGRGEGWRGERTMGVRG